MAAHPLRVNAGDLLRHPGERRTIASTVAAAEIELSDPRIDGAVEVDLAAMSSVDGITVEGTVAVGWRDQCRRCLRDVAGTSVSHVVELFQRHPSDPDSIEIVGDHIDLEPVVREYVLLDLPSGPLCRPECVGICPICGADRNETGCGCDDDQADPRWAGLDALRPDVPD